MEQKLTKAAKREMIIGISIIIFVFLSLECFLCSLNKEDKEKEKTAEHYTSKCVVTGLYVGNRSNGRTTTTYLYAQVQDSLGILTNITNEVLSNARYRDSIILYCKKYKNDSNFYLDSAKNLTNK